MIYTHVPTPARKSRSWPYLEVSHLVGDSDVELFQFGAKLGLAPANALKTKGKRTHFAVSRYRYTQAIRAGATVLSVGEFVGKLNTAN